ncbi:MAG: ATP-binding protein, partial [Planctomycetota bacterium]
LADELRGIESWVIAAPSLKDSERKVADSDARQHLETAKAILKGFDPHDREPDIQSVDGPDPSDPLHESSENTLARTVRTELNLLERLLADPQAGLELADPHVRAASRAALALTKEIEDEARALGASLVQSSEEFVHIVLVVSAIAGVMLLAAATLFQRRILRPLAELRDGVRQVGSGNLDLRLTIRHNDELGLLANTLQAMTERLRAHQEDLEERVKQRTNELLRTARLADLGTLAAGVAHEINNPLAAIATCAEGLLRDSQRANTAEAAASGRTVSSATKDATRTRDYLQIIAKEAMRARDTTARLLAFARPESGRRDPVWLSREVKEVVTMLEHSAGRAGIRLDLELQQDLPPVLGDPADLRQVAFNLVKNALDASPDNTTIRIRTLVRDGQVVLEVVDEGIGIPQNLQDRIFEPFVTSKEPGKGTGLGLAISHRIVTDHSGSLRAQNLPVRGACFTMTLPPLPGS